jgi:EAL domain-containing protein (putative c-di-GMP-specific phosphodiesterase class I)
VCIEILEAPCSDEDLLREAVEAYRDLGMSIAMDDFGVAASDHDRVRRLRPDVVKIDKSILGDGAGRLLPAMVGALHEAGARVAVEGIDSRATAMAALDARADYLQGYFFASPERGLDAEVRGRELLDRLLHPETARAA